MLILKILIGFEHEIIQQPAMVTIASAQKIFTLRFDEYGIVCDEALAFYKNKKFSIH